MILQQLGIAIGGQMSGKKDRTTSPDSVGNDYQDGMGKMNGAPDERYLNEVVHPAGGRPDWSERYSEPEAMPDDWKPKTSKQRIDEAHEKNAEYIRCGRVFRITPEAARGERNKLYDEED